MHFSKYTGAGNDFIMVDHRTAFFPVDDHKLISKLCHRHYGIGADGLILLERSHVADFKMRIFNADGFEAEMCGNGIRCLFKFIQQCGILKSCFLIETKSETLHIEEDGKNVKVAMQDPADVKWDIHLTVDSKKLTLHHLNTGVPHSVIFTESIEDSDLKEWAPKIRHHPSFLPKGTNVNFASIIGKDRIAVRTYERGVEAETLACGTGATASALAAAFLHGMTLPLSVETKSGEELKINCTFNKTINRDETCTNTSIQNVTMSGSALFVYKGEYII